MFSEGFFRSDINSKILDRLVAGIIARERNLRNSWEVNDRNHGNDILNHMYYTFNNEVSYECVTLSSHTWVNVKLMSDVFLQVKVD